MHIRNGLLCLAAMIPLTSYAAKGGFDFTVDGKTHTFSTDCIKSIQYVENDEIFSENLMMALNDECGKRMAIISRDNIGKQLTISYKGNKLSTAMIASRLGSNFRISSKEMPRVVLMQILNDYEVARK